MKRFNISCIDGVTGGEMILSECFSLNRASYALESLLRRGGDEVVSCHHVGGEVYEILSKKGLIFVYDDDREVLVKMS